MEDFLTSPLHINDIEGIEVITGLLHDESFDLDGICFNEEAGKITILVRRQFHAGPEHLIKRGLVFDTYEKDWMHSLVTIRNVHSWGTQRDQGINSYTFDSWQYADGVIIIECNEVLILKIYVDDLEVEVVDIGFNGKTHIKRSLEGMESSSGMVYE